MLYNAVPSAEIELLPVLEEPLYLVSARSQAEAAKIDAAARLVKDLVQQQWA